MTDLRNTRHAFASNIGEWERRPVCDGKSTRSPQRSAVFARGFGRPRLRTRKTVREMDKQYLSKDNQTWDEPQACGVYRPQRGTLAIHFWRSRHPKRAGLHRFLGALKSFTFDPRTPVSINGQSCSDCHALLSDWAMVGADLYTAVKQYKISGLSVHPATSESETASTR